MTRIGMTALALLGVMSFATAANATIFHLNRSVGGGTVVGTITTDDTTGPLATANITDWDLVLSAGLDTTELVSDGSSAVLILGAGLTATVDILKSIARGYGPRRSLLALGYAGWGPGQLDSEIRQNGWLQVPAYAQISFDREHESKWERAISKLGIDPRMLSDEAGHA